MMVRRGRSKGSLADTRRYVTVKFIDGSVENIETQVDHTLQDIFDKACKVKEIEPNSILGLAKFTAGGNPIFLDLSTKISKHTPKQWKTGSLTQDQRRTERSGEELEAAFTLMVQYYKDKFNLIRDGKLRNYYCHQLRHNLVTYPFMYPDDRCFLLAAYSLLADGYMDGESIDARNLFPAWVIDKHSSRYIKAHLPRLIRDFNHLTTEEAEELFVNGMTSESPTPYNQHLYKVYRDSKSVSSRSHRSQHRHRLNSSGADYFYLGMGPAGVSMLELERTGFATTSDILPWMTIHHISFNRKKFQIVCHGVNRYSLYTESEKLSEKLLIFCKKTHQFYTSTDKPGQPPAGGDQQPSQDRQGFKECCINYRTTTSTSQTQSATATTYPQAFTTEKINYPLTARNRYSIVSANSSVTSGIVSDRTCLSYYGSQDETLNRSKVTNGSQDSLLSPPDHSSSSKNRPVQRAISEPSKKLRNQNMPRELKSEPPVIPRAASDNTVVRGGKRVDDHIYENVSAVRSRLIAAAKAKPNKLSPRVSQNIEFSFFPLAPVPYSKHKLMVKSQGALNQSLTNLTQLNFYDQHISRSHHFASQQNIAKPSPSMEQLLNGYTPPPSYSERHEKQRQLMLAAKNQFLKKSREITAASTTSHTTKERATPQKEETQTERDSMESPVASTSTCTCQAISYQEIDKLKQVSGLPLISALCNDKRLKPASSCQHCYNNNNRDDQQNRPNRPISWHSETLALPNQLPALSQSLESY